MRSVKAITYIIVTVAILAVLAAIGYFVYNFVRNGQKSFYLSYGNEKILAGTSEIELPSNTTVFFTGRTIAGVSDESTQVENYTVSVVPTQKLVTAIRYRVGEEKETYLSGDTDFSKAFRVSKKGANFSVFIPVELELRAAISEAIGKDLSSVTGTPTDKGNYFELRVVYAAENATVIIPLNLTLV